MFDIGFTELLVIGVVALIVVGPKDLPGMFRTLGRFTARARQMGREFTQAMNDAADESGIKDVSSTLKSATSPKSMGLDALNKAADGFEKWDPSKARRDQKKTDAALKAQEAKVAEDTAKAAEKISAASAKPAAKAADTADKAPKPKAAAKSKTAKKPAAKKPAAQKTAAQKTAAKKPAAKPKSTDTSDA